MNIGANSSPGTSADIYHDIYDFSIFPVSLGDILMWDLKSALRALAVGRSRAHVHLICDPKKSGFSPLQGSDYLADLLIAEAIPAFYSHPFFSGLSVYRSREDFRKTFPKIAQNDEISLKLYSENESIFQDKENYDRIGEYFRVSCSSHDDLNEFHGRTGSLPRLGYLEDCLVDWQALQAQFPKETFWVTLQFRLRKLDGGMPVGEEGLRRDAPFLTWYNFIREANERFPFVKFVVLGRMQEKPLELLRLPNVVTLRALGMNLGHEITALLNSDLFMGSLSGFAPAAQFTDIPYDVFNCTPKACEFFGIPYGADRLPNSVARQKIHYGEETTELLLETLKQDLETAPEKAGSIRNMEANRTATTNRFFIGNDQSDLELSDIFSSRLRAIALAIERGDYSHAEADLKKLGEAFPGFSGRWPQLKWLSEASENLVKFQNQDQTEESEAARNKFLMEVSSFCHPERLVRKHGRYFESLAGFEGLNRDGWCEKSTRMVFAPSEKGDFVVLQILGLPSSNPIRLSVVINQQPAMDFVLLNEYAVLEIPVLESCIPTDVRIEADRAFTVRSRDEKSYAYQIEGAGLVSQRSAMPAVYLGDKRESREKIISGIYSNGAASSLARIRIDHAFPGDTEVHLAALLPRNLRQGQMFSIQINDGKAHESVVTGKRLEAWIPCAGRARQLTVTLRFWDRNGSPSETKENRATIKILEVLPARGSRTEIRSGYRSALGHLLKRLNPSS
jgi:hypothetical protein